jgi:hypothetical protein
MWFRQTWFLMVCIHSLGVPTINFPNPLFYMFLTLPTPSHHLSLPLKVNINIWMKRNYWYCVIFQMFVLMFKPILVLNKIHNILKIITSFHVSKAFWKWSRDCKDIPNLIWKFACSLIVYELWNGLDKWW